jgi:hypothetical protein
MYGLPDKKPFQKNYGFWNGFYLCFNPASLYRYYYAGIGEGSI